MNTQNRKLKEKEFRRVSILDAAEKIMQEHGIQGLNIDLIAQQTELAKGTIYLYFKNKEEILSVLTIKARQLLLQKMSEAIQKQSNPIDKLRAVIMENYQFYKENTIYSDLVSLYEANSVLKETEELYAVSGQITDLVIGVINEINEKKLSRKHIDPVYFTFSVWGMTVGVLQLLKIRGQIMQDKFAIKEDDFMANYVETVINSIV